MPSHIYLTENSADVWGPSAHSAPIELPTVQWAIGPDAAFHWLGLGLLPYKDTFMSNATSTQKAGLSSWVPTEMKGSFPSFSGYHETNAATHALMALLSMAHVTFSDAVGETNSTLIKQLIRADGMLLKTDRPATAIDAQFQAMVFGSWPAQKVPASKAGSLFTMPCDTHNKYQHFSVSKGRVMVGGMCLTALGHVVGSTIRALECQNSPNVQAVSASTSAQTFDLVQNTAGPRGERQYALQYNSSSGRPLCLELRNGGAQLEVCDVGVSDQGFKKFKYRFSFSLQTTWHDDVNCLTVAVSPSNGAFVFDSEAEKAALADRMFYDDWMISEQYKDAYTMSAGLMQNIKQRQAQAKAQCKGKLGAVQGPLGEVYSTHTSIRGIGTWRYVVGVQLSSNFTVTTHDLAMITGVEQYVSYQYDHGAPGFKPAEPLRKVDKTVVLELRESANQMCDTGPECVATTPCLCLPCSL